MSVAPDSDPLAVDTTGSRRPVRAIAASIGLTAAALVVSIVGGVALVIPILVFDLDLESVPVFLGLTVAGQIGFFLVAFAYARYADIRIRLAVPDRRDTGYLLVGTAAALVLATVLSSLLDLLGLLPGSVIADAAIANPTIFLGLAVLSVVLIAPIEEFLFRGVIQTRLRRAFGPGGAILGASLLFGSLHLANYTGAIAPIVSGALLVAVIGAVLGILYEWTANLTVPILAHAIYNVVLLVVAFVTL